MFWWVYFYVYFVECWHYVSKNDALYNQNFDRLYVVEIVVLAIVLGMLWRRRAGAWRRFYANFLGAVLFNSVAFLVENYAVEQNKYYVGIWYDTPYLASFAGSHGGGGQRARSDAESGDSRRRRDRRLDEEPCDGGGAIVARDCGNRAV